MTNLTFFLYPYFFPLAEPILCVTSLAICTSYIIRFRIIFFSLAFLIAVAVHPFIFTLCCTYYL